MLVEEFMFGLMGWCFFLTIIMFIVSVAIK